MDDRSLPDSKEAIALAKRSVVYRIGGYLVAFVLGSVSALAGRYLLLGKTLQLNPDTFISLVFTVAIGAASLVLALLAINYGRVSEKVITERADRSIEIQMSLFEKSLDLQTRLFDKTTSTLESIGRSTGITELRMADIFSFFQNPDFMKQVAGRAVEETASELSKKGKEGLVKPQTDTQLAERLTKNIVRELSSRIEGLERAVRSSVLPTQPFSLDLTGTPGQHERSRLESVEEAEARRAALVKKRTAFVRKVAEAIPEVKLEEVSDSSPYTGLWDFILSFKEKKVAIDTRGSIKSPLHISFDNSIKQLFSSDVDCLLFVFFGKLSDDAKHELDRRTAMLGGRLRYLNGADESTFPNELLGVLESVAGALPSAE